MPKHLTPAQREHMAARRRTTGGANLQGIAKSVGTAAESVRKGIRDAISPKRKRGSLANASMPARRAYTDKDYQDSVKRAQAAIDRFSKK